MTIDWSKVVHPEDKAAAVRDHLRSRLRVRRDQAIAAGITVAGLPVQTDDLSQQRIVGVALAATVDPATTARWKVADGSFVSLDAPTIIGIAQAVRAHVQACFDHEAELSDQIEAGHMPDIDTGWP